MRWEQRLERRVEQIIKTPLGIAATVLAVLVALATPHAVLPAFVFVWLLVYFGGQVILRARRHRAIAVVSVTRTASRGTGAMLREDPNARFTSQRLFLFARRYSFRGTRSPPVAVSRRTFMAFRIEQHERPVSVARHGDRTWWWYRDCFYWENQGYSPRDVLALVHERQVKRDRRLRRAHALLSLEQGGSRPRATIPREVRQAVFERDGGRCANCGANFDLQYDHVIPVALGGASTVENLQLLCATCNQEKSDSL